MEERSLRGRNQQIVGVILAGGKSQRMGTDKAFLEVGGIPLIQRILEVLTPIFRTVAIVAKELQKFECAAKDVKRVRDLFPEQHALGGIYTALRAFPGKECFVFACDLPFLNPDLIRCMIQRFNGCDLLLPKSRSGLEPLHAIYGKGCVKVLEDKIRRGDWRLENLAGFVRSEILDPNALHSFDPEELSVTNVNTPGEFRGLMHISQRRQYDGSAIDFNVL